MRFASFDKHLCQRQRTSNVVMMTPMHLAIRQRLITTAGLMMSAWVSVVACAAEPIGHEGPPNSVTELRCNDVDVRLRFTNGEDPSLLCEAARRVIEYLSLLEIRQRSTVGITVVAPSAVGDYFGFGCYDVSQDEISVVTGHACANSEAGRDFFRVPNDETVYRSIVAHEVAHAIVSQNTTVQLSVAAHEYIAASVQFATMDEAVRGEILSRFSGDGFTDLSQINGSLYFFAPAYYLVSAYKHYSRLDDPALLLHQLLSGEIRLLDDVE